MHNRSASPLERRQLGATSAVVWHTYDKEEVAPLLYLGGLIRGQLHS
jgi:hypothetical protein